MNGSNPRRGVVLVTVLWAIALLSALAMAAATTFRGLVGVMAVERDRVQAEALLTAGLETAAGRMANLGDTPLSDGIDTTVTLTHGSVRAQLSDEGGRIDIGQAPPELLAGLIRAAAGPAVDAEGIAHAIVAWRQPESGLRISTANPPFTSIGELVNVPGVAPEWIAALRPLATVWGGKTVNPLTAPAAVIAALPGVDAARLAAFEATRRSTPADAARIAATLGPAQTYVAAKPQRVASAHLTARLADGYVAEAEATIAILPQDRQPYRVLVWNPLSLR